MANMVSSSSRARTRPYCERLVGIVGGTTTEIAGVERGERVGRIDRKAEVYETPATTFMHLPAQGLNRPPTFANRIGSPWLRR